MATGQGRLTIGSRTRPLVSGANAVLLVTASTTLAEAVTGTGRIITTNSTGTRDGYFYSFFKDGGDVSMTLGAAGRFGVRWSGVGATVVGLGWNPGSRHSVTYSGNLTVNGNGYLALRGWTTDPQIEYQIVEDFGSYDPSSGASWVGTVATDGSTYDVYRARRSSAAGSAKFLRYWSVRRHHRTSGTITTAAHFDAWAGLGLHLGTHDQQILAVAGNQSSGSASMTVRRGPAGPPPVSLDGAAGCRALHSVKAWYGGLTADITITNTGTEPIDGWVLSFRLAPGQEIVAGWNAVYSSSGSRVTATDVGYNAVIPPGASKTIGFQATHTGNTGAPVGYVLNGTPCD